MPGWKSKKTGKQWNDIESLHKDIAATDPSWANKTPQELAFAIADNPNYEPITDNPPAFQTRQETGKNIPQFMDNLVNTSANEFGNAVTGLVKLPDAVRTIYNDPGGAASAIANDYRNFYLGGNFLDNAYRNPGRVLGDVATAATAGAGLVGKAAKTGSTLGRAAGTVQKVAGFIDPASAPLEAVKLGMRAPGMVADAAKPGSALQRTAEAIRPDKRMYDLALDSYKRSDRFTRPELGWIRDTLLSHNIPINSRGKRMADKAIGELDTARDAAIAGRSTPVPDASTLGFAQDTASKLKKDIGATGRSDRVLNTIDETAYDFLQPEYKNTVTGAMEPYPNRSASASAPGQRAFTEESLAAFIKDENKALNDFYSRQHQYTNPLELAQARAEALTRAGIVSSAREYLDKVVPHLTVSVPGGDGTTRTISLLDSGKEMSSLIKGRDIIHEMTDVPLMDKLLGKTAWSASNAAKSVVDPNMYSGTLTLMERVLKNPNFWSRQAINVKGGPRTKFQKVVRTGHRAARIPDRPTEQQIQNQFQEADQNAGFKRY